MNVIENLQNIAETNNWWWEYPLINMSDVNKNKQTEIVYEWWKGTKKLTTYSTPEAVEYIKVWGTNMDNEMEDGILKLQTDYIDLWNWISN